MSHWHGGETNFEGKLTESAKEAFDKRMDALATPLAPEAPRPQLGSLVRKYQANRSHALAADAGLRASTGCEGYIHFQAQRLPGRLGADEERYQVPFVDLPDDEKAVSRGMYFRNCIKNTLTGSCSPEVDWGRKKPSVWKSTDGGGDTWPYNLKFFYKYKIRGSERYDPPHRSVRCRERAISKAGGTFVKSEFSISLGYLRAPWGSEANYQLLKAVFAELFRNYTHAMGLFKDYFYERIVRAKGGGSLPSAFGTEEHRIETWEALKSDPVIVGLGEEFSTNRWKSWTDRMEHYWPSFDVLLFGIIYVLVTRGICKNLPQDYPGLIGISSFAAAIGAPDKPEDGIELDIKALKEASKRLESKRSRGVGSLLVVAESLSNPLTRRLGFATMKIPQKGEVKLMQDIVQCKTKKGCKEWHIDHAWGIPQRDLVRSFLAFAEDYSFLDPAGFLRPEQVLHDDSLKEDLVVGKYSWDLARQSAAMEIRTSLVYMNRPPFRWAVPWAIYL